MNQVVSTEKVHLVDLKHLVEGQLKGVHVNNVDLVVYLLKGEVHVYTNICPHEAGSLDTGELDGDELVCPLHGWRFKNGRGPGGPETCLKRFKTWSRDNAVWVDPDELAAWKDHVTKKSTAHQRNISDLPGPSRLPGIGNVHQLLGKQLHQLLEKWCTQYGLFYRVRIGSRDWVVIGDPAFQSVIIRERPIPWRRVAFLEPLFKEMEVHGVFDAEGEEWRRYRRLIMPAFNIRHLRAFKAKLVKVTERLEAYWKKELAHKDVLPVRHDLSRWAVDMTTSLVFDYDMNTIDGEDDQLQHDLHLMPRALAVRVQMPFPYWRHVKLPWDRKIDRALDRINLTFNEIIGTARARLAEGREEGPRSLLDAMIEARDDEGGPSLNDNELRGNMLTLLHAGEDTTSSTMAWLMYFLSRYPEVQEKCRNEVLSLLGKTQLPSFEQSEQLAYCHATIYETMRLKSVTPVSFMENTEEVVLGDLFLPKNTPVFLLMRWASIQDEYVPDAATFRPERWLDPQEAEQLRKVHNPFGGGPRYCPGRKLGLYELKIALAMICRSFRFAPAVQSETVKEEFKFTMGPEKLNLKMTLL